MRDILKLWWIRFYSFIPAVLHGLRWSSGWIVFEEETFSEDVEYRLFSPPISLPHGTDQDYDPFKKRFGIFGPHDRQKEWHVRGILYSEYGANFLLLSLIIKNAYKLGGETETLRFIRPLTEEDVLIVNAFFERERFRISQKLRERVTKDRDTYFDRDPRE